MNKKQVVIRELTEEEKEWEKIRVLSVKNMVLKDLERLRKENENRK